MTETPIPGRAGRKVDPWIVAGALFFIAAVLAAAYPALRAGPATRGGLLLLMGLAGVAFLGLFAFRQQASPVVEPDARAVLDALDGPAAVCGREGRLFQTNAAWTQTVGDARRLPRSASAGFYAALRAAARGEPASALMLTDQGDLAVRIVAIEGRRFLVQAHPKAAAPPAVAIETAPAVDLGPVPP
jgi:two-component system, cell cycle sensor histidine kinase and response regulator CckA